MTSSNETPAAWPLPDLCPPPRGRARPEDANATSDGAWPLPELCPSGADPEGAAAPRLSEQEKAYERGYRDGLREAESLAEQKIRPATEAILGVFESLSAAEAEFTRDRARNLQGLAIAVARKLIQREIAADPTIVGDLVQRALELLPLDHTLEVRLHPADLAALGGELGRITPADRGLTVQWTADPTLERGGFLVESPLRIVDGRSDMALRSLYERLEYE